jgi:hypothetical protein
VKRALLTAAAIAALGWATAAGARLAAQGGPTPAPAPAPTPAPAIGPPQSTPPSPSDTKPPAKPAAETPPVAGSESKSAGVKPPETKLTDPKPAEKSPGANVGDANATEGKAAEGKSADTSANAKGATTNDPKANGAHLGESKLTDVKAENTSSGDTKSIDPTSKPTSANTPASNVGATNSVAPPDGTSGGVKPAEPPSAAKSASAAGSNLTADAGAPKPAVAPPPTADAASQGSPANSALPPAHDASAPEPPPAPASLAPDSSATRASSARAPLRFDATRAMDAGTYAALVERLVLEYPDLARAQSLGKSRAGRDVWLLTCSDLRTGDPAQKPALCIACDLPPPASARANTANDGSEPSDAGIASPEAALFVVARLLHEARTKPALAALLQERTLYVLPSIDPEHGSPSRSDALDPTPRACRIDRNFPAGWQPWGAEPGVQGPYPLSEPESEAVATFLAQRSNLSAVLLLARDGRIVVRSATVRESADSSRAGRDASRDERDCERVCAAIARAGEGRDATPSAATHDARIVLHPPSDIARHGGDFVSFCADLVGLSVFASAPWSNDSIETPLGPAPLGFETATAFVERLLSALPRLSTEAPKVERLRNNLWMIDVVVHNDGLLPTLGDAARERGGDTGFAVRAREAKLVAAAVRRAADASYEALRPQDGGAQVGHLDGQERVSLRLLVDAAEGTSLDLSFDSQRAGHRALKIPLQ